MRNIQAQKSEASFGQQVIWQYWKDGEEIYSLFVTDSKLKVPFFKIKSMKIILCLDVFWTVFESERNFMAPPTLVWPIVDHDQTFFQQMLKYTNAEIGWDVLSV